ncbi:MAG: GtrA family protein [Cyanobacteriota bacterium]|jgi:putative flippase GtrA
MNAYLRFAKFGLVGVIATAVHLSILLALVHLSLLPKGPANVLAFVTAFLLSNTLQQQFTFSDRLAGQLLKKRSVLLLFIVNAVAAYFLASQAHGLMIYLLAFVPAILNYTLLHLFSGHSRFKR